MDGIDKLMRTKKTNFKKEFRKGRKEYMDTSEKWDGDTSNPVTRREEQQPAAEAGRQQRQPYKKNFNFPPKSDNRDPRAYYSDRPRSADRGDNRGPRDGRDNGRRSSADGRTGGSAERPPGQQPRYPNSTSWGEVKRIKELYDKVTQNGRLVSANYREGRFDARGGRSRSRDNSDFRKRRDFGQGGRSYGAHADTHAPISASLNAQGPTYQNIRFEINQQPKDVTFLCRYCKSTTPHDRKTCFAKFALNEISVVEHRKDSRGRSDESLND